jgi:hypothetical protein
LTHEAELEAEHRAIARKPLDLLSEVTGHDPDASKLGRRELSEENCEHRSTVDRQHGLRPLLSQRPETRSLPRRHDNGIHG